MGSITTVAIQGEEGSFSAQAAERLLGPSIRLHSCQYFEEVFASTTQKKVDCCLVPIENSLAGSIHQNYDRIRRHQLKIKGEIFQPIELHLVSAPGVSFEDLESVASHPVALEQCQRFFELHPHLVRQIAADTSGSVREMLERATGREAAIAGARAAEVYGGVILRRVIQDSEENYTRFFLLSCKQERNPSGNKTSIVFSLRSVPGALFKSLSVFSLRDIDLTKIESRPLPGRPWQHLFYLDFLGNVEEERVRNALNHLQELVEFLDVLGCYEKDSTAEEQRI